jgi:hypothetical protein
MIEFEAYRANIMAESRGGGSFFKLGLDVGWRRARDVVFGSAHASTRPGLMQSSSFSTITVLSLSRLKSETKESSSSRAIVVTVIRGFLTWIITALANPSTP